MAHDIIDPRGIWRRAYELLKQENEALVNEYEEKILLAKDQLKLNGKNKVSPGINPDELHGMLSLTNEMIRQEEHKQAWNQSVMTGVQIVTSMKDIVAQAIKNSPEASLAWAGLCLILPGLSKVIRRISYYPSYAVWLMSHRCPGSDEAWNVLEDTERFLSAATKTEQFYAALSQRDQRCSYTNTPRPRLALRPRQGGFCKPGALCGLGGAGKSRIALEYIYQMHEQDPDLCSFWVYAASKSSLQSSYETIRREIPPEYIRTLQSNFRTGAEGNVDTESETISLVTQWLRSDHISRWLLVVDNADDLTFVDATHPEESHLMNLIPSASNGKVLITSRNGRVAEELVGFANRVVKVDRMTMTEAMGLFRSMLPDDPSSKADIEELAEVLMCLPLAIKQACAYIRATYTTVSEYLLLFMANEMNQKILLEENFGDNTRRTDVPNAVIFTWQMSFEKIKQQVPVTDASEILAFMAMVSREEIPMSILTCRWRKGGIALQRDIGTLLSYSLITSTSQRNNHFSIHRLVQLTVRAWLEKRGELEYFQAAALEVIHGLFREAFSQEDWPQCRLLYRHAQTVCHYEYGEKRYQEMKKELFEDIYYYSHPGPAQMDPFQDLEGRVPPELSSSQSSIIESHEFHQWMRGEERGLLILGPPGGGKTSVCISLIGGYFPQNTNSQVLHFLFTHEMREDNNVATSVLLELLGQLCRAYAEGSRIPDYVRDISRRKDSLPEILNIDELVSVLASVADDLKRETIVVLDGIDEIYPTDDFDDVVRLINCLLDHQRFRVLASSRKAPFITEEQILQRMRTVELPGETDDYVRIFIMEKLFSFTVSNSPLISQEQMAVLLDLLDKRWNNFPTVFGWTTVIPHMIQQLGFHQIINIIESTPDGSILSLYDAVFASMPNGQRMYVERIFCWLTYSLRPITSGELLEAINSDLNTNFDESDLMAMCHPLATLTVVGEERVVSFTHISVKRHVLKAHASLPTGDADAHWIILSCCLRYLLLHGPKVGKHEIVSERRFELLFYAAKYWPKHWQACISPSVTAKETDMPEEVRGCMRQLFDPTSTQAFLGWLRLFDPLNPDRGYQLKRPLEDFPPQATYIAELSLPVEILVSIPHKTVATAQPVVPT
ncbi:hypothetical protein BO79DRAFT_236504 [Aspergillus costaricaensis CBS 115574]|uniref:Uncharacterized protein n=1 Tax=Aspergillus costaricaensis CBS 115574 TaxID=1448317 RepID=A0ACD1IKD9_9EURO|nr:hypothetical protein BO79DRAFT_236504 [Aspergillus costaricaensis CBS 115574]RAK90814.1 hypothetical protein BO79DRAFT_236504 [Aspergillus costaricaensis CBS 115574]